MAGATGTGKTVTLQVLAEGFSRGGVPVFVADVKGDLSGLSQAGESKPKLLECAERVGMTDFRPHASPTVFWDLFGQQGHPIRATVSDMGPLLLADLLGAYLPPDPQALPPGQASQGGRLSGTSPTSSRSLGSRYRCLCSK